jgi:predicted acetyltransferase
MTVSLRDARERDEDRRWFTDAYAAWLREFGGDAVVIAAQHAAPPVAAPEAPPAAMDGRQGRSRGGDAVAALASGEARQWLAATDADVVLILRDAAPVGFALVQRASPALRTVAEYYLAPAQRRRGVGGTAATLLFDRFGGEWQVATLQRDALAVRFWRETVRRYTGGRHQETLAGGEVRQRFFARAARVPEPLTGVPRAGESSGTR